MMDLVFGGPKAIANVNAGKVLKYNARRVILSTSMKACTRLFFLYMVSMEMFVSVRHI